MAVTVEQIKAEFREFRETESALIAAKLADAIGQFDAVAFGKLYDQAVKYQTCHLIALSPHGEFARIKYPLLEPTGATTIYERRVLEIKRSILGPMVI